MNWNADGVKARRNTLIEFLTRLSIQVACISETHLIADDKFKIPGFKVYRKDRLNRAGGVALLIKNDIKHYELLLPATVNLEVVGIKILLDNSELRIISTYKRPSIRLPEDELKSLFDGSPTLMIGDLNAKNVIWGCRQTNRNGEKLLEFASNNGLMIAAPDDFTYFPTQRRFAPDILDIVLI